MIPDRLRELILAIVASPRSAWREAYDRLSVPDRAELMKFMRDHYPDHRSEELSTVLTQLPSPDFGPAFDRLSAADQDRMWALLIQVIYPPGHWSAEEMPGRSP
jgi:hypothetical protein